LDEGYRLLVLSDFAALFFPVASRSQIAWNIAPGGTNRTLINISPNHTIYISNEAEKLFGFFSTIIATTRSLVGGCSSNTSMPALIAPE
jgi:hypothetical protein